MYPEKREKTWGEMLNRPSGWILLALLLIIVLSTTCGRTAEAEGGFNFVASGELINLPVFAHSHSTHRGDSFLSNSQAPGSAGTTSVGGSWVGFCTIGVEYQKPLIAEKLQLSVAGSLMLSDERDQAQNENDSRNASESAQIFSSAECGGNVQVGLLYNLAPSVGVGLTGQLTVISERYGWSRFGEDETSGRQFHPFVSAGPKVRWGFCKTQGLECGVLFGELTSFRLAWVLEIGDP